MKANLRIIVGIFAIVAMSIGTLADQAPAPQLNKVMRAKLAHSQAILEAVVTSNWPLLDRESRALALAVRDPAWGFALTEPEYLSSERRVRTRATGSDRSEREAQSGIGG